MAKKQLTIRYSVENYHQFIQRNPEFKRLSVGMLLEFLMNRFSEQKEKIELQQLLIDSLSQKKEELNNHAINNQSAANKPVSEYRDDEY